MEKSPVVFMDCRERALRVLDRNHLANLVENVFFISLTYISLGTSTKAFRLQKSCSQHALLCNSVSWLYT